MLTKLFGGNPQKKSWKWFAAHADDLAAITRGDEPILDEVTEALHKVNPGLSFEIGLASTGQLEFFVSANGRRALFPAVEELVASAPPIPNWRITAFKQPKDDDLGIVYDGFELSTGDIWFASRPRAGLVDLTLYIRGMTANNKKAAMGASFVLLDNALGEYLTATGIGELDWQPLPDDPAAQGLQPLSTIGAVVGKG